MPTPEARAERWRRAGVRVWTIIGALVLAGVAMWVLGMISRALVPFLLALVILFLLRGVVGWLEGRRVPRIASVAFAYVFAGVVVTLAGVFIVPPVAAQFGAFFSEFPKAYAAANRFWLNLLAGYQALHLPGWVDRFALTMQDGLSARLGEWSSALAGGVFTVGSQTAGFVLDFVLALVIAFYLLVDYPKIRAEILSLFKPAHREEAEHVLGQVTTTLTGFLRGQVLVALSVGLLAAVALWALGVPYAFVIGIITGLLDVIPYLGPLVGMVIAAISAAFVSPWLALWAVVAIFAVQQAEGLFIAPRIMSGQVDLHPVLVIFSLLVGATLFGVVGMLLSIPVAAVGKGLFVYYYEKHTSETLAAEDGALFRDAKAEERRRTRVKGRRSSSER
jgi:predicted PurR-regulated permease PerM